MDEKAIIYLAGFFDGEGSVGLYDTRYRKQTQFRVSLCNNINTPLLLAQEMFGGSIRKRTRQQKTKVGVNFEWYIYGHNAEEFLEAIRPYLIIKDKQVDVFLEARKNLNGSGEGSLSETQWKALEEAEHILKSLKKEVSA